VSFTIVSALRWWARETPDRIAFNVDGAELTWSQLSDWAQGSAANLLERGIKHGDRVAVLGTQSLSYLALAIGAQFVGAIIVPLNTRYTKRELSGALEDTAPVLLFVDAERHALASEIVRETDSLRLVALDEVQQWRQAPTGPLDYQPQRNDICALMSTSGTTSKPKFVVFTHDMIVSIALELQLIEPRARQSRVLIPSPFFSGGLYVNFEYMVLGCTIYIRTRLDGDTLLNAIETEQINIMATSTIFYERMAAAARFKEADLSSWFWAVIGGSRVSPALVKSYRDKGVLLRCLYGQTEAGGSWAATGKALEDVLQVGYGGPFTQWRVVRDNQFGAASEIGEIVIRGPSVTPGYWNNPEATSQILRNGWLHTGDLGVLNENGSLTFVDRIKDIVKSGGFNISAAEVEHVVSGVRGVEEVAVIAAEDPDFGETPLAVIYAKGPFEPASVIEHCRAHLSSYKVPKYVVVENEPLPRLNTGKISKPALREKYKDAARRLVKLR
jgi:fatty-acyl-CoA synthase